MAEVLYTRTLKCDRVLRPIVTVAGSGRSYQQEAAIPGVLETKLVKPLEFRHLKRLRRRNPALAGGAGGATVMPHKLAQLRNR